jgi:hypothetical protein
VNSCSRSIKKSGKGLVVKSTKIWEVLSYLHMILCLLTTGVMSQDLSWKNTSRSGIVLHFDWISVGETKTSRNNPMEKYSACELPCLQNYLTKCESLPKLTFLWAWLHQWWTVDKDAITILVPIPFDQSLHFHKQIKVQVFHEKTRCVFHRTFSSVLERLNNFYLAQRNGCTASSG